MVFTDFIKGNSSNKAAYTFANFEDKDNSYED